MNSCENEILNSKLLKIISEHIKKEPFAENVTSSRLRSLAQAHQLVPIVYYQTRDKELYQYYLQTIHAYTQRKTLLEQINKTFSDIPFYTVKGLAVSTYYPIPQLRTMGDCDIVVHEEDKERARQALLSIGFKYVESKWDNTEWHFEKNGLDFELHHRLLYDEIVNTEEEKAFADTAWNYVRNHELDINFHFVFLLIHIKKHLLNCGVGIRQFMDLAVISKNAYLDPVTISNFIEDVRLEKFAGICSALCSRWFGVPLPVNTPIISDDFYYSATDMILTNGVFGFNDPKNSNKEILNSVSKYGKIKSILYKFFPSYADCSGTLKYKWIKGKPYLMPLLWLYRPIEFLFSGRIKMGLEHWTNVTKSEKVKSEWNANLSAWGLNE